MPLQYNDLSRRLRVDFLMRVFQLKNNSLNEIREESFDLEKTIQKIVERNLDSIFPDLEFLKTEHTIDDFRLDTIAFDTKKRSFVIIEYKKIQSHALVAQGIAYREAVLDNKEIFVLLYNRKKMKHLVDVSDINWNKTKVIFISPEYTKYQKKSNSSERLQIELYEIKKYQNGTIILNRSGDSQSQDSPKQTEPSKMQSKYIEEDYLDGKYKNACVSEETKAIWHSLKAGIKNAFNDIEFKQTKFWSRCYLKDTNITICTLNATKHKIYLCYSTNDSKLIETSEFIQDVSDIGKYGIGNFRSSIKNIDDISSAIPFIRIVHDSKKQRGIISD